MPVATKWIKANITAFERNHDPDGEGFDSEPVRGARRCGARSSSPTPRGDSIIQVQARRAEPVGGAARPRSAGRPGADQHQPAAATATSTSGTLWSERRGKARVFEYTGTAGCCDVYKGFTTITGVAAKANGTLYVSELFGGCGFDQIPQCFPAGSSRPTPVSGRSYMRVPSRPASSPAAAPGPGGGVVGRAVDRVRRQPRLERGDLAAAEVLTPQQHPSIAPAPRSQQRPRCRARPAGCHDGDMDAAGCTPIDPDDGRPGVLGLVVVLALVVATALLLRSFTQQLKKIDFEEEPDDGPGPTRPSSGDAADGPRRRPRRAAAGSGPADARTRRSAGRATANRLADATSPYLLQHADNPVDWWPWGAEAFAEARRRDVPVLLSVGLRRLPLVPRDGARVLRGRRDGGVPERALRLRQGRPRGAARRRRRLHGRDPGDDRPGRLADDVLRSRPTASRSSAAPTSRRRTAHGMPAFRQVLAALVDAWTRPRDEVSQVGADVVSRLRTATQASAGAGDPLDDDALAAALETLAGAVGPAARGLRRRTEVPAVDGARVPAAARRPHRVGAGASRWPATRCTAMARGGIYDQLGGGFARYSVDASWVVPHFEKMLYDNALLLRVYLHWWRQTGDPLGERVARETADFLLAELRTEQGGFASALDADSEGVRAPSTSGRRRSWSRCSAPTTARGRPSCSSVTDDGHLRAGRVDAAAARRTPTTPSGGERVRAALLAVRGPAAATGPRRQGRGGVERSGRRGPGRGRRAARRAGLRRRGGGRR